jgi:hypothetical protein
VVTRDSDFADIEALPSHPYVVKCWRLPRGHTLYELYHPVFDRIYDSDHEVGNAARMDPVARAQDQQVFAEERKLLAPLYREVAEPRRRPFCMRSRTTEYLFFGRGKNSIKWPQIGTSAGWGEAQTIRVAGRLLMATPETIEGLRTVFKEWVDCMTALRELTSAEELRFSGEHFSSMCEFAGPCGDAVIALLMVLTATRKETALAAIGFFHPEDYSTPFQKRDGPGKDSAQVRMDQS